MITWANLFEKHNEGNFIRNLNIKARHNNLKKNQHSGCLEEDKNVKVHGL